MPLTGVSESMTDSTELKVLDTVKVRASDTAVDITLPREVLDESDLEPNEYAILATNGRALFLVPSTVESIRETVGVGDTQ